MNRSLKFVSAWILAFSLPIVLGGCSPKIYVIDRQSILEQEAAGKWPSFEQWLEKNLERKAATPLGTTKQALKENRALQLPNGSLSSTEK